jgi:hypothetical protein
VYTPDVVAVGEGPATWTDFFSQQLRWARGSNEVMVKEAPRRLKALDWGPRLHYLTLMLHYPTVAITWILGTALTVLYMALGSTGVVLHVSSWLALYIDVFVARLLLYFWLRRFNISPHEEKGSAGMSGIFVSVLCTPFYSSALVGALLRRKLGFVVTPKGKAASPDRLLTFRKHLFWAAISTGSIAAAASFGHFYPANVVWAALSLVVCLLPIGLWMLEPLLAPRRAVAPNPLPAVYVPQPQRRTAEPVRPADPAERVSAGGRVWYSDEPTLSGLDAVGAGNGGPTWPAPFDDDTMIIIRPAAALDSDTMIIRRPTGAGVPRDHSQVDQDTVVTAYPSRMEEDALPARGQVLAHSGAAADVARPRYVEDLTLTLHPRRRRVSLDGLLEELTDGRKAEA